MSWFRLVTRSPHLLYKTRDALGAARRFVPEPVARLCRERGWRPGVDVARFFDRWYEPDVRRLMRATIRPGHTCIDVGAGIGIHTAYMAQLVGLAGHVIAYEAHPQIAAELRSHVSRRKWGSRVRPVHAAAGDGITAALTFYMGIGRDGMLGWCVIDPDDPRVAQSPELIAQVPALAIDADVPEEQPVQFVKIDTEGAGASVLAGMSRILSAHHPTVFMEVHNRSECEAVLALSALGYNVRMTDGTEVSTAEGMTYMQHFVARPAGAS